MWPALVQSSGYDTDDSEKVPSVISDDDHVEASSSLRALERMKHRGMSVKKEIRLEPEPYEPEHLFFSPAILK